MALPLIPPPPNFRHLLSPLPQSLESSYPAYFEHFCALSSQDIAPIAGNSCVNDYALGSTGVYASKVLGRARLHAHSTGREPALRGQYLVRRSARWRSDVHLRLRHRLPRAWTRTGARVRRPPIRGARLRFAFSLGSYSGHSLLSAFVR